MCRLPIISIIGLYNNDLQTYEGNLVDNGSLGSPPVVSVAGTMSAAEAEGRRVSVRLDAHSIPGDSYVDLFFFGQYRKWVRSIKELLRNLQVASTFTPGKALNLCLVTVALK